MICARTAITSAPQTRPGLAAPALRAALLGLALTSCATPGTPAGEPGGEGGGAGTGGAPASRSGGNTPGAAGSGGTSGGTGGAGGVVTGSGGTSASGGTLGTGGGPAGAGGAGGLLGTGGGTADAATEAAGEVAGDPGQGGGTTSAACGQGGPVPMEGVHDIPVGAVQRRFFLRLPAGYDGKKAWPVIFAFHGAGNKTAAWFDGNTDLRAVTEDKAVLVFPEGALRPEGGRSWVYMSADNVLFVDAMLAWLKKSLCIDPSRLYAAGQSSGGYMSMTLGCQRGTVFRAVATSSGGILEPGACTGNPVVWMRTGRGDTASTVKSVHDTRDFWIKHKGCSQEAPKPVDPSPCVRYSGCQGGVVVNYCEDGGGHEWPGYMSKGLWALWSAAP